MALTKDQARKLGKLFDVNEAEATAIVAPILESTRGNVQATARILNVDGDTIYRWIAKYESLKAVFARVRGAKTAKEGRAS